MESELFAILDKYYVLKNPELLGVEPENALKTLIDRETKKAYQKGYIDGGIKELTK